MQADPPATVRIPLRRQLEAAAAAGGPNLPPGLLFHAAAEMPCGDRDVLFGYQLFLGRDPENSFVIASAKANSVQGFMRGLLGSTEFHGAVAAPLQRGQAIPHEGISVGPAEEQLTWLLAQLVMPADVAARLRAAEGWRAFFTTLATVPGISLVPPPADSAPARVVTAADADAGFLLIHLDQPKPGERLHPGALLSGNGWAIAGTDIVEVAVWMDDTLLTLARYGLPRPDVARNFPHYRHVDHCGFAFSAQVPREAELTRQSQLVVAVRTESGQMARKGIRIEPPPEAVAAPATTWPIRLFIEDVRIDDADTLRLRGWAVARAAIANINVFLAEEMLGSAETGLARPDIAATHGEYANAADSGFVFAATLQGCPPGPQALRVQVTDSEGARRQAIVPITVPRRLAPEPAESAPSPAAEAVADIAVPAEQPVVAVPPPEPTDAEAAAPAAAAPAPEPVEPARADTARLSCDGATVTQTGGLRVTGWALAEDGVADITLLQGGTKLATATLGLARPDVARVFRDNAAAPTSGFRILAASEPPLAAGTAVTLRLRTGAGDEKSMDIVLEAEAAPARAVQEGMRLEIDRPARTHDGGTIPIRGALMIDGWAVAPAGIAGITVLGDGKKLGDAYVGRRREDIGRAYPNCLDSLRAGFALVLPPGTLVEGEHEIEVVAKGRCGTTTQHSFKVLMEAPDTALPGSLPRQHVPRMELAFSQGLLARAGSTPSFTVLLQGATTRGARPGALAETLASLAAQVYARMQVSIILPGKAACDQVTRQLLAEWPELAARTRCVAGSWPKAKTEAKTKKGAAGDAGGALVMVLRAGDVLGCDALLELAAAHAVWPEDGFIYGDDVRFDPAHGREAPFYKPDYSPELLLGMDYIGRPWCATEATLRAAGLDHAALAALPPYAASLRLTAAAHAGARGADASAAKLTGGVRHINKVLARMAPDAPDKMMQAARAELDRTGIAAEVSPGVLPGLWRVRRATARPGLVSVIIPTAGRGELIRNCITSLRATTAKRALEIIVLDNIPAREKRLKSWVRRNADQVIEIAPPFNWSRYNNAGARLAHGDYLLFLNDDIEAPHRGWLEALLEQGQRPEVGVVGARLLYPDGKVQHAGQYLADTHARHSFRFSPAQEHGPFGLARVVREMASVTGACQLVRHAVFKELGGFDEAHDVINNDLDFCLRAQAHGLSVIFTPFAELMHHELASRADIEDSFDAARFGADWRVTLLRGDPFHSRRLMAEADHAAPEPEPVVQIFAGPNGLPPDQVRRILAVKLDHIGDYLTAVPALRALKARFPQARLTLLAPPATAALARHEASVDAVQEFVFFHARSAEGARGVTEAELQALGARLAPEHFDLAIDLRMQPETRAVLRHSGARILAGYDQGGRYPWLDVALEWEGDLRLTQKHEHVSDRLLALVGALENACRPMPPSAVAPVADASAVPALAGLPAGFLARPLVCLHPGVGNPVRQWPAAHFAGLIDLLAADLGMGVVLIGGGDEQMVAQEVLAQVSAKDAVVSLVGAVPLHELGAVMQACAIFVGNNSGPQHLAASLGVPSVGIHSGVVDAGEWAPLGPAAMALQRRVICGPCYLEFTSDCPRGMACLHGIKPRDVLAACRRLLAMRPGDGKTRK